MKFYRLADNPSRAQYEKLGVEYRAVFGWTPTRDGRRITSIRTREFRAPKAGEYYLSGASPAAYRAPNDLTTAYRIMRLVAVNRETKVIDTIDRSTAL